MRSAATAVAAAAAPHWLRAASGDQLPISGQEHPQLTSFDEMMHDFVLRHEVIGASLAVTRDGRLVYARGFGLADRQSNQEVQPNSLFRVASLSKAVTGVAVAQLVERGTIDVDTKICRLLNLHQTKDPRWQEITIGQLLHHTGGWNRDKSFDPMFRSISICKRLKVQPPARQEHVIQYMAMQPLDFGPGQQFAYSNFGYCLLGRVIERFGRETYGECVRRRVLVPLGIRQMQLGATLPSKRRAGEVRYYDLKDRTGRWVMGPDNRQVPLPYGAWCLESMDSHGGWIASAVEMVRFAAALDVPEECPVLKPESVRELFVQPDGPAGYKPDGADSIPWYGWGWNVRPAGRKGGLNAWHTGSLDGTSTLLVRRHDGTNWAVLFNTREDADGKVLSGQIDPLIHRAADAVSHWPEIDQFDRWL